MKNEAIYHVNHLVKSLGYEPKNIQVTKIKQSNKKPCYLTHFDLEKCSIPGFIFQDDSNEWVFNLNQSAHTIDQDSFIARVKESEFLKRKLNRTLEKEAKINLSHSEIKAKDIEIKNARKLKNNF